MALINYLTQIQFEFGAHKLLSAECERLGITRPLLVTDAGIVAAGIVQKVLTANSSLNAVIFDKTPPNPNEAAVRAASDVYLANACDGIIALGGGSPIDCAKGVAILVTHGGELKDYSTISGGAARIRADVAPVIAVPTTSGTGSEVARGAILIVNHGRKLGFHNWHLMPKAAICDPELTLNLPPALTAATGMDAIAHCMESFMVGKFNPPADAIALDGLRRGWAAIERATRNGQDADARRELMSASMQGAMAFQKGLGCVHSLSHSLGGYNPKLHHGTLNAILLPAVIEFNASAASMQSEHRLARMAQAMGLRNETQVSQAVREINARLGLPSGLAALGVKAADFQGIIDNALKDHCHATNPRVASFEDYRELLLAAM